MKREIAEKIAEVAFEHMSECDGQVSDIFSEIESDNEQRIKCELTEKIMQITKDVN